MSQSGALTIKTGGGALIQTLTGNSGGAVSPDLVNFNINLLGNNTSGINVVGNPGTSTLTITAYQATTSQEGTILLATNAQAIAGVDAVNAVTSAALAAKLGTQTAHSLAVFEGSTSALTALGAATNGQLPIGSTGVDPVLATLTAGTGIAITNGAGSITIASSNMLAYTNVTHLMSPYTVLSTDDYISVDCSGGVVVLNFPNAPAAATTWVVKDRTGNAFTNNISITTPGGTVTFDGLTTYKIISNYGAINLIANSTPTYEVY